MVIIKNTRRTPPPPLYGMYIMWKKNCNAEIPTAMIFCEIKTITLNEILGIFAKPIAFFKVNTKTFCNLGIWVDDWVKHSTFGTESHEPVMSQKQ